MKCSKCGADMKYVNEDGNEITCVAIRVSDENTLGLFKRHVPSSYEFCNDCLLNALGIPDDVDQGSE